MFQVIGCSPSNKNEMVLHFVLQRIEKACFLKVINILAVNQFRKWIVGAFSTELVSTHDVSGII